MTSLVEGALTNDPVANEIKQYFHCKRCMTELPDNESPQSYRRYDVGWTRDGLQVWCVRHQCNIIRIDFEGQRHPAELRA